MDRLFSNLLDLIGGLARFRWQGLLTAWLVCLAGWLVVTLLPSKYESTARVFVDTRTALSSVIKDLAIQQDVTAQLSLVQQSLLSDAQVGRIMEAAEVSDYADTPKARAKAIDKLRRQVQLNVENVGDRGQPGGTIYSMSYQDADRARSLKVLDVLLKTFIENTLGGKLLNSELAQKFLNDQIKENEHRLHDAEQRLANFKKKYVGSMPGEEGDYFKRLQAEIDAKSTAQTALSVATSRRDELARQLRAGAASASTFAGAVAPVYATPNGPQSVAAIDTQSQLADGQARLDALLLKFTDKHPEVIALQETITNLKARRDEEMAALRRGDENAVMSSRAAASPVYQSIQKALNDANVEIASLGGEIGQHQRRISELRMTINSVPEVEAEFARLNRDYEVNKAQYMALVERLGKAKLGQEAEASSSVRFEVIDPPTASFQPVKPNRRLLVLHVFIAAVALGLAVAYILNALSPVFNHGRDLEDATGLPVIGIVTLTTIEQHDEAARRNLFAFAALAGGLLIATVVALLFAPRVTHFLS